MNDATGRFRIDRDGAWRHEGQEVTHPGVLRNLYANLRVDDHGACYLQVGPSRIPVEVDDTPFVVVRVETAGGAGDAPEPPRLHLNDGTTEALVAEGLWLGARDTPYCRVKSGLFVARLSLAAWLQLAPLLEEGGAGTTLRVGERRVPVPRRS